MRRSWIALAMLTSAGAAGAQPTFQAPAGGAVAAPDALLATWGTPDQCRARGDAAAGPHRQAVEIGPQWLRQGLMYCLLTWHSHRADARGSLSRAHARCGEDLPRDYRVVFLLRDGELRIRWSQDFTTPALDRCP